MARYGFALLGGVLLGPVLAGSCFYVLLCWGPDLNLIERSSW